MKVICIKLPKIFKNLFKQIIDKESKKSIEKKCHKNKQ